MRVKDEMTQNAIGVAPRAKLRLGDDIAPGSGGAANRTLSPDAASVATSVKATVTAMIFILAPSFTGVSE